MRLNAFRIAPDYSSQREYDRWLLAVGSGSGAQIRLLGLIGDVRLTSPDRNLHSTPAPATPRIESFVHGLQVQFSVVLCCDVLCVPYRTVPTRWVCPLWQVPSSANLSLHFTGAVSPSPSPSCTRSMLLGGCFRNKVHANILPIRWRALRKKAGRFILSDCRLWRPRSTDNLSRVTVQDGQQWGNSDKAERKPQILLNPSDSQNFFGLWDFSQPCDPREIELGLVESAGSYLRCKGFSKIGAYWRSFHILRSPTTRSTGHTTS